MNVPAGDPRRDIKAPTHRGAVFRRELQRKVTQVRTLFETGPTRVLRLYVHPRSVPVHFAASPAGAPYLTLGPEERAEITAAWLWTDHDHALVDVEEVWK